MNHSLTQARETNRVWLESRGCIIRDLGACVLVRHPEFAEYNALFDVVGLDKLDYLLAIVRQEFSSVSGGGTIFLPLDREFEEAQTRLLAAGFRPAFRSQTLAARVVRTPRSPCSRLCLSPVTDQTIDRWIQIYEYNYGLEEDRAAAERARWLRVFVEVPDILFYFIESDGQPIGTVQLVLPPNGWCGIYALSISHPHRGLTVLRSAYQAVLNKSAHLGAKWAFFDRLRAVSQWQDSRNVVRRKRHWHGINWGVLSTEVGFQKRAVD